ncbi:MAG: four helix bundle protein [Selenomonadaceae bacterium]|nr:four helix bundle protein [Selenomonadaceae bacterium]
MGIKDFKELLVWQKSMKLAAEVYRITKKLPKDELFGLTNQLRRAAVSIPSNIAEGNGRDSTKEYLRFLYIARGSRSEVETQLLLCVELGYLQKTEIVTALEICTEVGKMLNAVISKFKDY